MMDENRVSVCKRLVANLRANLWLFITTREKAKAAVAESQRGCERVKRVVALRGVRRGFHKCRRSAEESIRDARGCTVEFNP